MASDDNGLIAEARGITDYDSDIFTDSEFQALVDIGKEELRAEFGEPSLTFYEEDTFQATRALFWFVCIGAKIRAGEIAGINLTVGDLDATQPAQSSYDFWFSSFQKRLSAAASEQSAGPSHANLSRTDRTYGDQ